MTIAGIVRKSLSALVDGLSPRPVRGVTVTPDTPAVTAMLAPIVAFARGDQSRREDAITLHRKLLSTRPDLRNHPAQMFMAEVDTPCPDLGLRADSRRKLAD